MPRQSLPQARTIMLATLGALVSLVAGFFQSARITSLFDQRLYQDEIIFVGSLR
jgi:predicted membrane-bound spermidine synthase